MESIVVALIGGAVTLAGVVASNSRSSAVMEQKIDELARRVVVHYTDAAGDTHQNLPYFSRSKAGASAHYFIGKGDDIRQSVRECDTAWHAGNWSINLISVGIEVCSADEDFNEAQISSLAALV